MSLYHYVTKEGSFAGTYNYQLNNRDLTEVPLTPGDKYQKWDFDNNQWIGLEDTLEERYANFRLGIMTSDGWTKIKATVSSSVLTEFIGVVAYMDDNPPLFKQVWNSIVAAIPPTPEELMQWRTIAESVQVGIEWIKDPDLSLDFDDNGLIL